MARRPPSGVIEPSSQRAPNNPGGYFHEPDLRPRGDALPQDELGILGRLREAWPLLSLGFSKQIEAGGSFEKPLGGWRHSSPEPRVCRVNFPNISADERLFQTAGVGAIIRLVEGVDTGGALRSVYAPLQGIAFALPAGHVTAKGLQGLSNVPPATDNTVNITVSNGRLSSRWYTDHEGTTSAVLGAWPTPDPFLAPAYATRARVTVLDGALASPVSGAPSFLAGSQPVFILSPFGTLDLYGSGVPTVVAIEWEITE